MRVRDVIDDLFESQDFSAHFNDAITLVQAYSRLARRLYLGVGQGNYGLPASGVKQIQRPLISTFREAFLRPYLAKYGRDQLADYLIRDLSWWEKSGGARSEDPSFELHMAMESLADWLIELLQDGSIPLRDSLVNSILTGDAFGPEGAVDLSTPENLPHLQAIEKAIIGVDLDYLKWSAKANQ